MMVLLCFALKLDSSHSSSFNLFNRIMDSSKSDWMIHTTQNKFISQYIGGDKDKVWKEDFCFVHGADPQFGCNDFFKNPKYDPKNPDWTFEIELAKRSVERVNTMSPKPRFFVICGDLTNEYPMSCEETKRRQIEDFKKVFREIRSDIPLIYVCGNHDIGNEPTIDSIDKYRADFGCDYFSFWCGGVLFIVLNSQYFINSRNVSTYASEQEAWLDSELAGAKGKQIICFSHVPWFVEKLDEQNTMYNIPLETRKRLLDKLYQAGVRHFFCGHLHANVNSYYKDSRIIVSSAIGAQFGPDVSGFNVVNVSKDVIDYSYVAI